MKKNAISLSLAALCLSVAGVGLANAQTPTPKQAYKEAISHCERLSGEAKSNCKRDAHAAYGDRHRKHTSHHQQNFEKNRTARCHRLPEPQRQQCIEQMQGQHHTKKYGSVKGGGVLRHTTIEIPGEPYEVTRPVSEGSAPSPSAATPAPTTPKSATERVITPIN